MNVLLDHLRNYRLACMPGYRLDASFALWLDVANSPVRLMIKSADLLDDQGDSLLSLDVSSDDGPVMQELKRHLTDVEIIGEFLERQRR